MITRPHRYLRGNISADMAVAHMSKNLATVGGGALISGVGYAIGPALVQAAPATMAGPVGMGVVAVTVVGSVVAGIFAPQLFGCDKRIEQATAEFNMKFKTLKMDEDRNVTLASAYKVLGCAPNASHYDVAKCYRELQRKFHPDKLRQKGASEQEVKDAEDLSYELNWAYELIRIERGVVVKQGAARPCSD